MNCREIQILLSAFVDGELTQDELIQIKGHLAKCDKCIKELEELRRLSVTLKEKWPVKEIPSDIDDFILQYVMSYSPWKKLILGRRIGVLRKIIERVIFSIGKYGNTLCRAFF